ncbi:transcription elongation factor GreA [Paenibacillus swuensis]|uniref:Transcription elongation factor GreA n=1 Tax=Paenibacillus swuensis TaxID=1178515 RepID=A0A172TGL3_9BACL|nr:transcription elongation factor GreA [Paenibacillus swuensis]ANE46189.1 transcription elongation factor GreA [Paenibacillus swuensis]
MAEEIIITPQGLQQLEDELDELKTVKRKELSARLKTAIAYGDLKENSEYHSAKDDQSHMETRIKQIEKMLKRAKVVDTVDTSKVNVGSLVILNDIEFAEKIEYRIVGASEADAANNKISYESPLGSALMGKSVGAVVTVNAPVGEIKFELLEIRA